MYIHSVGSFMVEQDIERREISQELKKYTASQPRPVNRFILLALVGALKCLHRQKINKDCTVLLATEFGNIENIYKCLREVYINKELPMPFAFLNTLNNMAGFHLAKTFGLLSKNLTISTKGLSFESSLQLARTELELHPQIPVLVGGTDSAFETFDEYRPKYIPEAIPLKEGSAWLYLNNSKAKAVGELKQIKSFTGQEQLEDFLKNYPPEKNTYTAYNILVPKKVQAILQKLRPESKEYDYLPTTGYFGTETAAGLVQFLKEKPKSSLLHISKNFYDKYILIELSTV
jgi:hypothetical protein